MSEQKTYQELSRELDDILGKLKDNDGDIDQALELYEKGAALAKQLEAYLKTAANKVTKLKQSFEA